MTMVTGLPYDRTLLGVSAYEKERDPGLDKESNQIMTQAKHSLRQTLGEPRSS